MAIDHNNPNPKSTDIAGFERQDISGSGVLYFFLALAVGTIAVVLVLVGVFDVLDKRSNAKQAPPNPLAANIPADKDTRHIPKEYEVKAFPEPRLENDERSQLLGIITAQEQTLNSYGWADENTKTVRIPIDRAMDLLAQRGLPVHQQGASETSTAPASATKPKKDKKK
jgi:hypothetical protein